MADIFDEISGSSPQPTGDIFDQIMPTGPQARMPEGFLATAGNELSQGASQVARGASQAAKPVPDLEALRGIGNMVGGAARMYGSASTGAGAAAGQAVQDATQPYIGETGSAALAAGTDAITQLLTGLGMGKLMSKGGQLATRAAGPVFAAQDANVANVAQHAGEMQQYLQAVANRGRQAGAAMAGADAAGQKASLVEGLISKPGTEPFSKVSPLAEAYRVPGTSNDIYAGVNATLDKPVSMPGLSSKIDQILERVGSTGVAPGLTPKSAIKATSELGDATTAGSYPAMDALAQIRLKLAMGVKGELSLGDMQTNLQGIGKMARSADSQTRSIGKQLYRAAIEDLSASPNGKVLLDANRDFSRNLAVDDLARTMTRYGSDVDKLGNLKVIGKLSTDDATNRFIQKNFTADELSAINSTLSDIGMMKKTAADLPIAKGPNLKGLKEPTAPDIVTAKAPQMMNWQKRLALHAAGGALNFMLPGAGMVANGAIAASEIPKAYSKMIFALASKPALQPALRAIFRGSPPNLLNVGQMQAVANLARASAQPTP